MQAVVTEGVQAPGAFAGAVVLEGEGQPVPRTARRRSRPPRATRSGTSAPAPGSGPGTSPTRPDCSPRTVQPPPWCRPSAGRYHRQHVGPHGRRGPQLLRRRRRQRRPRSQLPGRRSRFHLPWRWQVTVQFQAATREKRCRCVTRCLSRWPRVTRCCIRARSGFRSTPQDARVRPESPRIRG